MTAYVLNVNYMYSHECARCLGNGPTVEREDKMEEKVNYLIERWYGYGGGWLLLLWRTRIILRQKTWASTIEADNGGSRTGRTRIVRVGCGG